MSDHDVYLMDQFMNTKMSDDQEFLWALNSYKEKGLLRSQDHPTLPLKIWNYTETCQFEKKWDEITMMCRGLVTDNNGKIIAKPFGKFFNIEEKKHEPTEEFEVFDKVDGSLGIFFFYDDGVYLHPILATRGSFTSEQAIKGFELFSSKYTQIDRFQLIKNRTSTFCFEIVYPENRVVVKYNEEKLVLLGGFDSNHNEIPYDKLPNWPDKVKRYDGLDWQNIQSLNWENSEGFVVRFANGSRCKIKFEDYVRLHRVMTNFSSKAVFECLKNGKDLHEILKDTPDEFYANIKEFADNLKTEYGKIHQYAMQVYNAIGHIANRKKFAEQALSTDVPDILFKMKDGKEFSDLIWKRIEPPFEKLS